MVAGPHPISLRASSRLDAWSRLHAPAMLVACVSAALLGAPWPAGAAALLSFGVLLVQERSEWATVRRIAPNAVTALRLLIIVAMAVCLHGAPGTWWTGAVVGIFVLDWLDGWLARLAGATSAFGAHFDMETDALVVLVVDLELFTRGRLGAWILATGVLRYLYVVSIALFAPRGGEAPRSTLGRNAFGTLVTGLCIALASPTAVGTAAAVLGTTAVALSFVHTFYWSYLRRAQE
jgi:phosphatidylglycerophosphate synthase